MGGGRRHSSTDCRRCSLLSGAPVTRQPALLASYLLRAVGISFVMLAWLEFRIIRDLERHRDLAIIYGLTSALFFVTIVVQALLRGFNGAQWC